MLQDLFSAQPVVLIGLIANLIGSALQEDIAGSARRFQQLGQDILSGGTPFVGEPSDAHLSLLIPARLRRVPRQFSWVDQRLVRERYIGRCGPHALAPYLFLVTVADAQGLSYYGDGAIAERLGWCEAQVRAARAELVQADLIAFRTPLYQVLSLDAIAAAAPRDSSVPVGGLSPPRPAPRARARSELRTLRALLKEGLS